ncbi:hypothetical protein SDC9_109040 [bioreactor metagenome]|uniref:Uncharacterized protein n=1 Tax=bioreactor metagenome TaxID=1076179 RepID=A0A645BK68_9ZZZZ
MAHQSADISARARYGTVGKTILYTPLVAAGQSADRTDSGNRYVGKRNIL